jgi:hypothetical protein
MDSNLESIFNFIIFIPNKKVMEYLSLYDYLKKPSGKELGGEVAKAAQAAGIPHKEREISNPKYTGKVHLYPKDFLDFHFRKPEHIHIEDLPGQINTDIDDDDLPF